MTLRTPAKIGIVFTGLVLACAIAWVAVELRQLVTPAALVQGSPGMYAFGDTLVGVAVFGVVALVPLALALYWLRPVVLFWSVLVAGATMWALTGIAALAVNIWAGSTGNWWAFMAMARLGVIPLSALALVTCALFAPLPRQRWPLLAAGIVDGLSFVSVVLVKFILFRLEGR